MLAICATASRSTARPRVASSEAVTRPSPSSSKYEKAALTRAHCSSVSLTWPTPIAIGGACACDGCHSMAQMTFLSRRCERSDHVERKKLLETHSRAGHSMGLALYTPPLYTAKRDHG